MMERENGIVEEPSDSNVRRRSSRLTPLITQLQLSTPRQNTTQNTEKPSKNVVNRPRSGMPHSSRRKTPRAIFDDIADDTICGNLMVEKPQISLNVANAQPSHPLSIAPCSQVRKRAAMVQSVVVSPKSTLTQEKMHKKSKRGQHSDVEVMENKTEAISMNKSVLKRAISSYSVSSGSVSPAPVDPPRLLRHHASEQSIRVDTSPPLERILPTTYCSKHPDLDVITPETVAKVLRGDFKDQLTRFELLDCRFPFEFEGGSLKGASLLCDPEMMEARFFVSTALENCKRTALIFFCEFSANRAPKMLRHVRNVDRRLHVDSYPELYYPELYLIDGGYKHCFETLQNEICAPSALYITMEDGRFVEQCRHEFAVWRRRWKSHKVVANCTVKLDRSTQFPRHSYRLVRSNVGTGVRSLFDEF